MESVQMVEGYEDVWPNLRVAKVVVFDKKNTKKSYQMAVKNDDLPWDRIRKKKKLNKSKFSAKILSFIGRIRIKVTPKKQIQETHAKRIEPCILARLGG